MRRILSIAVIAMLVVAVASPVNAGYLVIRIILDGSGGGGETSTAGAGGGGLGLPGGKPGAAAGGLSIGGIGGLDGPPRGGQPGGGGPAPADAGTGLDPLRSVVVVIPIEEDLSHASPFYNRVLNYTTNPNWKPKLHWTYRNQKIVTNLFTDGSAIQWYDTLLQVPAPKSTRATQVKDKYTKWVKSKTDSKLLYDALTAALEAGLIDDAVKYADELLAFAQEKKDGLPAEVAAFASAYKHMQRGIKGSASQPSTAADWQAKLDAPRLHVAGHYALIYWDASQGEVDRRLAMLEENFKGFYLWHATRGIDLYVPETPLTVILAKRGSDVLALARALDVPTRMPADGFYSADHDLLVLSPERLDDVGQTFVRQSQQTYRDGVSREKLLAGQGPEIHKDGMEGKKRPDDVARMQTIALVDRLVEDQSAMCAISREGTRQLLYASARLPRFVALPEWLSNGSVNFFTRPKDPAFISSADNKSTLIHVATATGYGAPNYALQRYFKDLVDKQELNPDRAALLKNILTDAYFHGLKDIREARDPDPVKVDTSGVTLHTGGKQPTNIPGGNAPGGKVPGGSGSGSRASSVGISIGTIGGGADGSGSPGSSGAKGQMGGTPGATLPGGTQAQSTDEEEDLPTQLRKKRARLSIKAQATSWALYYYLTKNHPNELRRFLDELATLPRDLPLDGDTIVAAFCRSFGLDGSKPSLAKFADTWLASIRDTSLVGVDIKLTEPKPSTGGTTGGSGSPGPMGLGGSPPP